MAAGCCKCVNSSSIPSVNNDIAVFDGVSGRLIKDSGVQISSLGPHAPNTSIQFNNGGVFGGSSHLEWDNTFNVLQLNGRMGFPGQVPFLDSQNAGQPFLSDISGNMKATWFSNGDGFHIYGDSNPVLIVDDGPYGADLQHWQGTFSGLVAYVDQSGTFFSNIGFDTTNSSYSNGGQQSTFNSSTGLGGDTVFTVNDGGFGSDFHISNNTIPYEFNVGYSPDNAHFAVIRAVTSYDTPVPFEVRIATDQDFIGVQAAGSFWDTTSSIGVSMVQANGLGEFALYAQGRNFFAGVSGANSDENVLKIDDGTFASHFITLIPSAIVDPNGGGNPKIIMPFGSFDFGDYNSVSGDFNGGFQFNCNNGAFGFALGMYLQGGNAVVPVQFPGYLADGGIVKAYDVYNRKLYGTDGVTVVLNHQTQQSGSAITTAGYTANVSANIVYAQSTFTGNTGATAYHISDVVRALKNYGLLAA